MSPGIIANPFAAGIGRKNSLESISSIDRDLSPEELEILQKVGILAATGRMLWRGKSFWKSLVSPLVYGICSIMGSGLPFYGISRSQHFHHKCTRMGLWNLHEVTGAPSGERALGEVALTLVSPRRWKWWEKQLNGREKKWRKWWEIFHVAESVLDSGSAKPVSPKENATDYLYPIVNAMGGLWAFTLRSVPLSYSSCFLALPYLPMYLFGGTPLLFTEFIFVTCWYFLAKLQLWEKWPISMEIPHLISSFDTVLHELTRAFMSKDENAQLKVALNWRSGSVNQSQVCAP